MNAKSILEIAALKKMNVFGWHPHKNRFIENRYPNRFLLSLHPSEIWLLTMNTIRINVTYLGRRGTKPIFFRSKGAWRIETLSQLVWI